MSMPGCTLEPSVGKVFLFSLVIPRFGVLSHVSSLRLSSGHLGPVLTLRTSDAACAFHPALLAGAGCKSLGYFSAGSCGYACSLCVCVCVCVFLLVMLLSEIPKLPTDPPVRGFPTVWRLLFLPDSLPRMGLCP